MKPEQRIEQVLMKWLVQCSDCRTIQGAKHIMPRIVQEILTALTEPEDERKRFPKGKPSSMEDIFMEYPHTEPEDEADIEANVDMLKENYVCKNGATYHLLSDPCHAGEVCPVCGFEYKCGCKTGGK